MPYTVLGQSFFTVEGEVMPKQLSLIEGTRPAVNGHAFHSLGVHSAPTEIRVERDFTTEAGALTAQNVTYPALVGLTGSIQIAGRTYTNVFILRYEPGDIIITDPASGGIAGGGVWLTGKFIAIYAI